MALPININDLINGLSVEWERIEFKEGWNDKDILHTICAFANDFSNQGGGYIVIGIAEKDGRPILPPVGLEPAEVSRIQHELFNLCKQRINYEYTPYVEPVVFQGKLILVIWCPGGQERPYEAPESFVKGAARHYYIRKSNHTIKPSKAEREELLRFSAIPFDDRINYQYNIKDLSPSLIRAFLQEIGSRLFDEFDNLPFLRICRLMNVVEGPDEYLKPKNFALMFFNEHPEKIFPQARIEIINFQTPGADSDFTEINIEGPLHVQLKEALKYLKFQVIKEKIHKVSYQAEAIRYFNFPYEALEEILANAIFHRNYEIREPIEIRIHPDRILIISFPGPDHSISMEDMESGNVSVRRYRNRQIGNLLKELKLTEAKCTGIPLILKAMQKNGSPQPIFQSPGNREGLVVTIPVHESYLANDQPNIVSEPASHYLSAVALEILSLCHIRAHSASEIRLQLELSTQFGSLRKQLLQLISNGFLEYTIPDIPDSILQKYRTTSLGASYPDHGLIKSKWHNSPRLPMAISQPAAPEAV